MIEVGFYKGKGKIGNAIIRWWTKSIYSHTELVIDRKKWMTSASWENGVITKHRSYDPEKWDFVTLNVDSVKLQNEHEKILKQKYDYLGIFFYQFLPFKIHNFKRWWCTEHNVHCLKEAGFELRHKAQFYNPQKLYEELK